MDRRRRRLFVECVQKYNGKELGGYCGAGSESNAPVHESMALCLEPSIDRTAAQTGIWTPAEDEALKAVEFHGKNCHCRDRSGSNEETVCE
jgi:hypothetical protein